MCFVFKQEEPVFIDAVDINVYLDSTGVNFFRLVKVFQDTFCLKIPTGNRAHIHKGHWFIVALEFVTHVEIPLKGATHCFIVDLHISEFGMEGCMTAMIGPVGVDHFDFGNGGAAAFRPEVFLAEQNIGQIHRKPALSNKCLKLFFRKRIKSVNDLNGFWLRLGRVECFNLVKTGFARLNWVNNVVFDCIDVILSKRAR